VKNRYQMIASDLGYILVEDTYRGQACGGPAKDLVKFVLANRYTIGFLVGIVDVSSLGSRGQTVAVRVTI
jgi:hypothetical protein